ncbi:MAG: divergent polysaccharide deacetylase family protein [Treponema sp.]|nr:divergent polysaccharide deacetylase family protein [Treponema sp.]
MKSAGKKPKPLAKKAKSLPRKRRKRRGKLALKEKVLIASVAAFFVAAAIVSSLLLTGIRQKNDRDLAAAASEPAVPMPAEQPPPTAPNPAPSQSAPKEAVPESTQTAPQAAPAGRQPPAAANPKPGAPVLPTPKASKGSLVFVIDDAGNNLRELEPFLAFPGPLTIAVLPGLPNSAEAARRVRAAGKEVFLHQPMESLGGLNPGPGAIYAGMPESEIRSIVNRNLDEIWPVAGINNHEGSKVTMDREAMEIILAICRERGILFLDSRTTADTQAPIVALAMGMSIEERDVFLDNSQDPASILGYLNKGLKKAEEKGKSVMIGHTWSPALAPILSEKYSTLKAGGYSFATVSDIIRQ